MNLLPKNELKKVNITPRIFYIWGESMSGKTFLASKLPAPVILNTDGNGVKISTPSVEIQSWEHFVNLILEIEKGQHTFKTIVIDLVDDIKTMMDLAIIEDYNKKKEANKEEAESIADIPFGRGFAIAKNLWKQLMMRLSKLNYYIVFISHSKQNGDGEAEPALEKQYCNMLQGRCDIEINTAKMGETFLAKATKKRSDYPVEAFTDKQVYNALENVKGLVSVKITPLKKVELEVATPKVKNLEIATPKLKKTKEEELVLPEREEDIIINEK